MAPQRRSVVIYAAGQSEVRVIVPAFVPTEGADAVAEALEMVRSMAGMPVSSLIAQVFSTDDVSDVEPRT